MLNKKSTRQNPKKALLILDMINTFDFKEGDDLLKTALPAAHAILKLKKRAKAKKIPVIYVNDNFGQWRSDWKSVHQICTKEFCKGREIAKLLEPEDDDYFILKPKHSGFLLTPLELLLNTLKVEELIITGIAGNICVFFTANDAHMRNYIVICPKDCSASNTKKDNDVALEQMEKVLRTRTPLSTHLKL